MDTKTTRRHVSSLMNELMEKQSFYFIRENCSKILAVLKAEERCPYECFTRGSTPYFTKVPRTKPDANMDISRSFRGVSTLQLQGLVVRRPFVLEFFF